MKHHIIYKVTCLVTGRYYVGMHSTSDLADGYMGSGRIVSASIKKHGRSNHIIETLERCVDRQALILREKELITAKLLADPLCMNLLEGGTGGWSAAMRQASRASFHERLKDEDFRSAFVIKAANSGTMVSADGRAACSTALKLKYQDSAFRDHQRDGQMKANSASWTPEARERRLQNRLKRKEMVEMHPLNATKVSLG
jgi:hypothetical protein